MKPETTSLLHWQREFGELRRSSLAEDYAGIDWVLGNVPLDIKASRASVGKACNTGPSNWGISEDGIVILWSHLNDEMLGDGFEVDDRTAGIVYSRIRPILREVVNSPRVLRVTDND